MLFSKTKIGWLLISLSVLVGCGGAQQTPPAEVPTPVKPVSTPLATPEPQGETQSFSGVNWSLTVPSTAERKRSKDPHVLFVGFDDAEKRIFMLVGKGVKGNSATGLDQFTTEVKSDFVGLGYIPISESKGTINGVPFNKIDGFKPPMIMHNWLLVKSEEGYLFACGGIMNPASNHDEICDKSATSLSLK